MGPATKPLVVASLAALLSCPRAVPALAAENAALVRLRPGAEPRPVAESVAALGGVLERLIPDERLSEEFRVGGFDRVYVARVEPAALEAVVALLRREAAVAWAGPDLAVRAAETLPDDPFFPYQWALRNTGAPPQKTGSPGADVDAPGAWATLTDVAMPVAILDSGVDDTHEELAGSLWRNPAEVPFNGLDDDGNGFVDDDRGWDFVADDRHPFDDHGHGTLVAGILAAAGNDGRGIAGVAWRAPILPLKILDAAGAGRVSRAIAALNYAAGIGVRLTNHSYGLEAAPGDVPLLQEAIDAAGRAGALIVAAAGNLGRNTDVKPFLPASLEGAHVVAVGASDRFDRKWRRSNYGPASVDLLAPGVEVAATASRGDCPACAPSGYLYGTGTSLATPHVTAVAGLAWSCYPDLAADEIRALLLRRADAIPQTGLTASDGRLGAANVLAPTRLLLDGFEETAAGWTRASTTSLVAWARVEEPDGNRVEKVVGPTPGSYETPWGSTTTLSRRIGLGPRAFVPETLRVSFRETGSLNAGDEAVAEACFDGCDDPGTWTAVREVRCGAPPGSTCPFGGGDAPGESGGVVEVPAGASALHLRFRLEDRPPPAGTPGAGRGWAIDDVRVEGSLAWIALGEPLVCPVRVH